MKVQEFTLTGYTDAGPFGGCVPVQMAGANATAAAKARRDQRLARSFMA